MSRLLAPVPAVLGCLRGSLVCMFLLMLGSAHAQVELDFDPVQPPPLPQRRLLADPVAPPGAPSSLQIEVARVQGAADAGLALASKALSLSAARHGVGNERVLIPRINHAYTLLWSKRHGEAFRAFRRIITDATAQLDARDRRLLEAWYGLGAAQSALALHANAAESFAEALNVHRQVFGLRSPDQLELLAALAQTEAQRVDPRAAEAWQQQRALLAERLVEVDAARAARHLSAVGRWHRGRGELAPAIELHQRALAIKEQAFGIQSPQTVGALVDLAMSFGDQDRDDYGDRPAVASGQDRALNRALEIVSNPAAPMTPADRLRLATLIADTNWVVGRRQKALQAYALATSMESVARGETSPLAQPEFLLFHGRELRAAPGSAPVLARFAVDAAGRARNIEIEGNAGSEEAHKLRRALAKAKLRPALENGRPVKTRSAIYRLDPAG